MIVKLNFFVFFYVNLLILFYKFNVWFFYYFIIYILVNDYLFKFLDDFFILNKLRALFLLLYENIFER